MFTLINNFDLFEEVPMQTTADRIHDLMIEKGMSQADLMRATNASKGTVSKWLSGTNTPSGRFLLNLASALGTTGDFLLSGNTQNTGIALPRGAKPQLMNPIQVDGLHHSPGMPLIDKAVWMVRRHHPKTRVEVENDTAKLAQYALELAS